MQQTIQARYLEPGMTVMFGMRSANYKIEDVVVLDDEVKVVRADERAVFYHPTDRLWVETKKRK